MKIQSTLQRTLQALLITGLIALVPGCGGTSSDKATAMPALAPPSLAAPSPTLEKPRLVLQITVDQFRGDLPTRYADRLGEGGLRYLLEEGIHYNNAHHGHANTETIVGHVTLATGAHPAAHGMIGG